MNIYRIFEYYNQTFWNKVHKGGAEFQEKVKKLRNTNEWLRENCLQPGRHFDKSQPWFPILGFRLRNESKNFKFRRLCEDMIRSEIDYTNLLKLKQTKFNWTIPTKPPRKKKLPIKIKQKTKLINGKDSTRLRNSHSLNRNMHEQTKQHITVEKS